MKVEIKVPDIGESINEVTLSEWFKEDGDYVKLDEALCEFESDKATLELPSEVAGVITRIAQEGDDLAIGAVIATIDTEGDAPADTGDKEKKEEVKEAPKTVVETKEKEPKVAAPETAKTVQHPSPAAKKILEEKNVAVDEVKGSGKDGRITKADAISVPAQEKVEEKKSTPVTYEAPKRDFNRGESREKMSRLRRTISKRLVSAKNETAMLTTFNEVDMTAVMEMRSKNKDKFKEVHNVSLGFMSFFIKASALSLQKFPLINSYVEGDEVVKHDFVDVSIAVSTPKGLVVPVVRNAESLSFAEIEKEVKRLAIKGRDSELTLDEMTGGTFTVSNGGVFGSLLSTPILNQPQSAILGMHKIQDRPMAENGQVVIRPMMYLALSYDHRIVDGKESVGFLVSIKNFLENPESMIYGEDPSRVLLEI